MHICCIKTIVALHIYYLCSVRCKNERARGKVRDRSSLAGAGQDSQEAMDESKSQEKQRCDEN